MNCKRKSRRRFYLLVRSRTPPISSEFRGGFEHPKPPLSVRHCLPPAPITSFLKCYQLKFGMSSSSLQRPLHVQLTFTPRFTIMTIYFPKANSSYFSLPFHTPTQSQTQYPVLYRYIPHNSSSNTETYTVPIHKFARLPRCHYWRQVSQTCNLLRRDHSTKFNKYWRTL